MTQALYGKWCREMGWEAYVVDWTDRMAGINLTGPKARQILQKMTREDLSNKAFRYMNWREMKVSGIPCLVFRLGFTGELSYELHLAAGHAPGLYREMMEAGHGDGLKPFGTEVLLNCRLEKGHIIPGMDTDGNTTLIGAFGSHTGFLWDRKKPDMVGGPVLRQLEDRSKMGVVGFATPGDAELCNGYIVKEGKRRAGHVTSVCYSHILGKTVGLALVDNHEDIRKRGSMVLFGDGRDVRVDYQKPPFYDPKGERMRI
jgi:sarcosine oxidase subunit alpha